LQKDTVLELLRKNGGILCASQAREAGVDNKVLQRMTEAGLIEKIEKGLYLDSSQMADEYVVAQYRCRQGIYSHETALYFHGLSDRIPFQLMMTIPNGYNSRILSDTEHYKFFYCRKELHDLGVAAVVTPYGNEVRVYDKERTICDCIRKKEKLDNDLVVTAVRQYMNEKGNDFARLLKYAEVFRVRNQVKQYMEVLT